MTVSTSSLTVRMAGAAGSMAGAAGNMARAARHGRQTASILYACRSRNVTVSPVWFLESTICSHSVQATDAIQNVGCCRHTLPSPLRALITLALVCCIYALLDWNTAAVAGSRNTLGGILLEHACPLQLRTCLIVLTTFYSSNGVFRPDDELGVAVLVVWVDPHSACR